MAQKKDSYILTKWYVTLGDGIQKGDVATKVFEDGFIYDCNGYIVTQAEVEDTKHWRKL